MTTLQAQMSERARHRAATLQDSKDDVETKDLGKESQQKKIQQLREKKLQQLRYAFCNYSSGDIDTPWFW